MNLTSRETSFVKKNWLNISKDTFDALPLQALDGHSLLVLEVLKHDRA